MLADRYLFSIPLFIFGLITYVLAVTLVVFGQERSLSKNLSLPEHVSTTSIEPITTTTTITTTSSTQPLFHKNRIKNRSEVLSKYTDPYSYENDTADPKAFRVQDEQVLGQLESDEEDLYYLTKDQELLWAMKHENAIRRPYFYLGLGLIIPGTLLLVTAFLACLLPGTYSEWYHYRTNPIETPIASLHDPPFVGIVRTANDPAVTVDPQVI